MTVSMVASPVSPTWDAWLRYEDGQADVIVLRVVGGVSDTRADELWSAIESALPDLLASLAPTLPREPEA